MARHAYAAEDKDAPRQAILKAAGALFAAGSGELPSMAQVAVAAGLAKGTVYLIFPNKGRDLRFHPAGWLGRGDP